MNPSAGSSQPEVTYLNHETTVGSWLLTRDHKRIGVMFLVLVILALLLGGVFAMVLRIELLTPGPTIISAMTYNRMFTLHGVTMVWLFMIPAIPSAFGNFVLPIMLGAKDVAFPRLNLASVYIYVAGAALTLFGMLWSGADTGWTFYTPYSTTSPTAVTPILMGVFVIGFSTIITGLNFITTVHTLRAPGMHWSRIPLFVWALYGTSVIQVVATPVLGMVLLLVFFERVLGVGIFDPSRGGDPVLFQHMFWFYSHPAVYIMVLPAMGVITEVVCAFSRKNIFGYKMIAVSTFGIAFVGFFSWGHHMFVSGQSTFGSGFFGVLSMLVAIFTAIKIFNWVATMYGGSIDLRVPLLYVLGFIFLLIFGGMTGVAVATTSLDVHWHDTYFIVAHFHYIMVGAVLMAFLAALHYWWPKMFGRVYPERWSFLSAITIIFGFIVTFLPQFLLGNLGMPRRYYQYPAEMQWLHVLSTAGASLLAFGFGLIAIYLLWSLRYGPESTPNPWGSRGYEWHSGSPPAPHNFTQAPRFEREVHDYTVPEAPRVY
ncbi:cbb3-type cytochrome c oxidase subunit I [Archangium lansingense]|uniref:Cbb3-type cytochrome c oxidase subunit I n=1 Tax=Archangium lansingense TaxID=2995310 RepID=A0ABT4AP55_9BACT|nr:cbb3-type cytochrome c oxidase subunit I [Archangium lansinium]MCY1083465.1 cbb3-type cytochrome c oxidase subunit I [Archangium lansinium]